MLCLQHWINNYNRKINGSANRQTSKSKQLHRKQSGFNLFTSDVLQKEKIGGSAEVFRTVGEKWRSLPEESREEYQKKAVEASTNLALPSNSERALKIIKNMMKEVMELEALGGQGMVLCSYDGMLYHSESTIGEKLISDKDLIKSFGSLLQITDMEKGEVSVKELQELFNSKYSDLVEKKGQKMPYVKAKQLGIIFKDLPDTLAKEIGVDPRKPNLYGSAQRRKLWLSRDSWKLGVSDSIYITSSSSTSIVSSSASTTSPSPTSQINPSTSLVVPPSTIVTSPSTIITSPGTIGTSPTCSTIVTSPSTIDTSPSTIDTSPSTITTSPSSLFTQATSCLTSTSLLAAPSNPMSSSSPVASSAGRSLLSISYSSGTIISKDTQFGMTVPEGNGIIHAVCHLCPRQQVHGRDVSPGNVVVEVLQIRRPGLLPLCRGTFDEDEPVCVGGFYEWPCSHLVLLA